MPQEDHYTWQGDIVHESESESHAPTLRSGGPSTPWQVTIGNVDLPAFFSNGLCYIQAPLPLVFEALAEDLPAFIRDMEIRVSNERGGTFSLDGNGRAVSGSWVAKPRVVRRGRKP